MNFDTTKLDATGKVVLDHIYDQETPLHFYNALSELDYSIPAEANPVFEKLISFLQKNKANKEIKLIDLGSSYGVNSALLKSKKSLNDLLERYKVRELKNSTSNELIKKDKSWYQVEKNSITIIGADVSERALDYALKTNLINNKLCGNFEERTLTETETQIIENTDLIISTGCIGYVGYQTIKELLNSLTPKQPIMAHFVLRTISFEKIEQEISKNGYKTYKSKMPFRQRSFASKEEKTSTLERLIEMGLNPENYEAEGSYYAHLYISLPSGIEFTSLPEGIKSYF